MLALQTEGEEAKWLSIVLPLRSNWLLRSVMAASFAAPLVSKLHYRSLLLHVYGLTPHQEEALLKLGLSIWGGTRTLLHSYSGYCGYGDACDCSDYNGHSKKRGRKSGKKIVLATANLLRNFPIAICSSRPACISHGVVIKEAEIAREGSIVNQLENQ